MAKFFAMVLGVFKKKEKEDGAFIRLENNTPEATVMKLYVEMMAERNLKIAA